MLKVSFKMRFLFPPAVFLIALLLYSCGGSGPENQTEPILRDGFSLYILDPGPFVAFDPEYPAQKEFLILQAGEVEISCGSYPGALFDLGGDEPEIRAFAAQTIQNSNWLPGCNRWMLDASEVTIEGKWFYYSTLLIRRDPNQTARMDDVQKLVHKHELERYADNVDFIVRLYYTLSDRDIYIFTLSGVPEEIVVMESDVRKLLASVRFSAVQAMEGIEE